MKTYLSAAHAGGQGKTTMAQILYSMLQLRGEDVELVAADFVDETGHSKIGKFYPTKVLELGIGANLGSSKSENDPNAPLRYWDRLGSFLLRGGTVVDVGANVISPLLQWARHRRVSQVLRSRHAPEIDLFLTIKAEKHAIDNAASLIREMVEQDALPVTNVYVVCNEVGGAFNHDQVSSAVGHVAQRTKIRYLSLPRCTSELWPLLEKSTIPVDQALSLSEEEISAKFGIDIWTATAGLADLHEWADTVYNNLKRVGV